MAVKGMQNPCADVATFTLGYTGGEMEYAGDLAAREAAII